MNFNDLKAITKEDLFALLVVSAPQMLESSIELQQKLDRSRNPHNDDRKPKIRERHEIIADYRIQFAEAQMKAMSKADLSQYENLSQYLL